MILMPEISRIALVDGVWRGEVFGMSGSCGMDSRCALMWKGQVLATLLHRVLASHAVLFGVEGVCSIRDTPVQSVFTSALMFSDLASDLLPHRAPLIVPFVILRVPTPLTISFSTAAPLPLPPKSLPTTSFRTATTRAPFSQAIHHLAGILQALRVHSASNKEPTAPFYLTKPPASQKSPNFQNRLVSNTLFLQPRVGVRWRLVLHGRSMEPKS